MAERTVGVALLGCGVVGGGVQKILREQRDMLRARTGINLELRHVVVKDRNDFPPNHAELPMSTDANAAIDDPKSEIIVELIGGTGVAGTLVERALKLGKPVVTANKSLLAVRGPELLALAHQNNTCIAFEASCGGGIPIIEPLLKGLIANDVHALVGIVNGTCNFILTQMTRHGQSYDEALKAAQKQGFAEANPTMDVTGRDSAQKLAILGGLAFGCRIAESDIHLEGIDALQPADIAFAKELGYVIKLLAIAERADQGSGVRVQGSGGEGAHPSSLNPEPRTPTTPPPLCLRVHPTLVHENDVLAEVSGSFNAISVYGHAVGHTLFYGRGAGQMPTAGAVVSDVLGVAMGTTPLAFKQLRIFPDVTAPANVLPFDQLTSRYYLRLTCQDEPGVMGQVTQILGTNGISLSAVLQHETDDSQTVPVVITTHQAQEGAMRQALTQLNALATVTPPAVCLRIMDQPKEFANG